jgi:hypothetical protein
MPWQETSGNGALDRGLAGADARGPGPFGGHGGDRPRGLLRRLVYLAERRRYILALVGEESAADWRAVS